VLARPLWALLLLHPGKSWGRAVANAWFAWSIEAGLLLLTIPAAIGLLMLVTGFALGDRARTAHADVVRSVVRAAGDRRAGAAVSDLADARRHPGAAHGRRSRIWATGRCIGSDCLVACCFGNFGIVVLWWLTRAGSAATRKMRRSSFGRRSIRWRRISFISSPFPRAGRKSDLRSVWSRCVAGGGIVLLMSGLAAVVATGDLVHLRRQQVLRLVWAAAVIAPAIAVTFDDAIAALDRWRGSDVAAATAIAHFFGDSFERRTNPSVRAVTGDAQLATLISLDAGRPHLLLDAAPERTPWLTLAKFTEIGGVVVWRASDYGRHAAGRHRATISRPGPEVPRAFEWPVTGRQPLLRIGWAIVRPKNAVSDVTPHGEGRIFARLEPCSPSCLILRDAAKTPLLRACEEYRPHPEELAKQASRRMDTTHGLAAILRDAAKRPLLRMRKPFPAPAPWRSRADPATPCACRTASAANRPDGTWQAPGSSACRCRSRTNARVFMMPSRVDSRVWVEGLPSVTSTSGFTSSI